MLLPSVTSLSYIVRRVMQKTRELCVAPHRSQVHNILGRHREDDLRKGWISGLNEQEGSSHPTRGGLRIGKKLNERRPATLWTNVWNGKDGQYYHYLTKWMHALNRAGRVTGDSIYTLHGRSSLRKQPMPGLPMFLRQVVTNVCTGK